MKRILIQIVVVFGVLCGVMSCRKLPNTPTIGCSGDGCYKFAECATCCMCFREKAGGNFAEALDSVQKANASFLQEQITNARVDIDKSYLHLDTLHVLNLPATDIRQFVQVWYYAWFDEYNDALPFFDYGVVDSEGNTYEIMYPND